MTRTDYREQKARRMLKKVGMELHKSRIRDCCDERYGMYMIVGKYLNTGKPTSAEYNMELDEVEEFIKDNVEPILLEQSKSRH